MTNPDEPHVVGCVCRECLSMHLTVALLDVSYWKTRYESAIRELNKLRKHD